MSPTELSIARNEILDKDVVKLFGANVKKYRIKNKLDQETLADSVDISIEDIKRIEDGLVLPSYDICLSIALRLCCTIGDLLTHETRRSINTIKRSIR